MNRFDIRTIIVSQRVKKNKDKQWDWWNLSLNPNITWDIIQQNPDKPWDWDTLCSKPNFLCAEEDILAFYASRIQKMFREASTNPHYLLCQKRIYREFEKLINL